MEADLDAVSCKSDADDFNGEPLLDALDAESPVCAVDDFCIDITGETFDDSREVSIAYTTDGSFHASVRNVLDFARKDIV